MTPPPTVTDTQGLALLVALWLAYRGLRFAWRWQWRRHQPGTLGDDAAGLARERRWMWQ